MNNYLIHHGIEGQKWGDRNGPPYPLNAENHSLREKKEGPSGWTNSAKKNFSYKIKLNKEKDSSLEKRNSYMRSIKNKSKRQITLEEEYKNKGMTAKDAEMAAYKRIRTEKTLAITAGLTVAAAITYIGYKHYDKNVDRILDTNIDMHTISSNPNKGVRDAFYVAFEKRDTQKYRGLYGETISKAGKSVYDTTFTTTGKIKIASEKSGLQAVKELMKDKSYSDSAKKVIHEEYIRLNRLNASPEQLRTFRKAEQSLKKGVVNKSVYDALNYELVGHDSERSKLSKTLYDKLRNMGYSGIIDVNDKRLSGYSTKNPTIIFDKSKIATTSVSNLTTSSIAKDAITAHKNAYVDSIIKPALVKKGMNTLITVTGISVGNTISNRNFESNKDKIVNEYRKEHPNTTLTYNEIIDLWVEEN